MSDNAPLIPVIIPPLVRLLAHAEAQKGSPLREAKVLQIRGGVVCMLMPLERAREFAKQRGPDLDPEHCSAEWQQVRQEPGLP